MASNQTSSSLPLPSTIPLSSSPTETASSSSSTSTSSSSSLPESSNGSGPEVGLAFEPSLLRPFMGLYSVDHPDDPWHQKAYNLYHPLYTGGGTFEQYLKTGRSKRELDNSSSSPMATFANRNTLTPEMLSRLLYLKSNFKKHYPTLYKSMMNQLTSGKSTTITVTPPEVPQHVSHRNLELAAAEIVPLETLIHTYQEDLKRIAEAQKQEQQQQVFHDPRINSYKNEFDFFNNIRGDAITSNPPPEKETLILPPLPETLPAVTHHKELSFWENPQNTLKIVEEKQPFLGSIDKLSFNEPQIRWENPPETLKPLTEPQIVLESPQENVNDYQNQKEKSPEIRNELPLSFWDNPEEDLKILSEQPPLLFKKPLPLPPVEPQQRSQLQPQLQLQPQPQDTAIEPHSLWETPEQIHQDIHNLRQQIQASENDQNSFLQPSALKKRDSYWAELEALEEQKEHKQQDDLEPIFDFDEDFE